MAFHYVAEVAPTKLELLHAWIPSQPWSAGTDPSNLTRLGWYRFDDPAGEVGIETQLLRTVDGTVLHVPLTYRGARRTDGDASLITTMTHSVLGERFVYDGCHDPVYVQALATAMLTGGTQVDVYLSTDTGMVLQPVSAEVRGSGTPGAEVPELASFEVTHDGSKTLIRSSIAIILLRIPGDVAGASAVTGTSSLTVASALTGTWPGQAEPQLLATIG